ncbi:MAG TPA: GMP synthase (glutamine-hydrolyzing) [Elusimicrobia bacterium]|nr:GMP synthase (glutamine-hydrolyzing) [Elusimicrobiota bacterium]HBT60731.1 GMP synthase (glutamine-hydrolyzing) [Elusimicrobiota bacterium]
MASAPKAPRPTAPLGGGPSRRPGWTKESVPVSPPPAQSILILDFGSQYTQLIARRLRELAIYAEILPYSATPETILARSPKGIILSGGPDSVHRKGSPQPDPEVFRLGLPILGICYGMQLLVCLHGGAVAPARRREYGHADLRIQGDSPLFKGISTRLQVWMSHGDAAQRLNNGFKVLARTATAPLAAIGDEARRWYGVQFHPEVAHTAEGGRILENFARRICGITQRWTMASLLKSQIAEIKAQVGSQSVVCALSGGVDSAVAAALIHRAIGRRLHCIFVETGLSRLGDRDRVEKYLGRALGLNIKIADASALFLRRLAGVSDPERKRKIIGRTFIEVFEAQARRLPDVAFLAQGTLYPDVIESVSVHGPSAVIKSHHNVGGLPKRMKLKLVEPLRYLFKDEVRRLGAEMGLPNEILRAHPFPGPGLAIRVLGAVTRQRLDVIRNADAILRQELHASGWYDRVWQGFTVLLPVRSVGVMGDSRTYENAVVLRCVGSRDGMTADWSRLPHDLLQKISSRIVSEVKGVNRVVYDVTSKPPATIEWE